MKYTMAIDQYGQHYDNLGKHPRKELMERIGINHAEKMYQDDKEGKSYHVGYVIGGLWLTLYRLEPIRKEA